MQNDNNSQNICIPENMPQYLNYMEITEQDLQNMFPDIYPELKDYIDKIAELLQKQEMTSKMISSVIDDAVKELQTGNAAHQIDYAIPVQANPRRRMPYYPVPYPFPYPYYLPAGYPMYGYKFSPQDLVRLMLLQRLGLLPY